MTGPRPCPNCGATLEQAASFCHLCGSRVQALHGADAPSAPPPVAMPPMTLPFGPTVEVPPTPMSHERALAAAGGIIMFATAVVTAILCLIYLLGYSTDYHENWDGWNYYEEQVIVWEFVMAGAFMLVATVVGVVGGIYAVRATRFLPALVGALLLLVGGIIELAADTLEGLVFPLVLGMVGLALVVMAKAAFQGAPARKRGLAPRPEVDGYGRGGGA